MRLVDLIASRTGHDLTPAAVFLHPTPRDLASHLAAATPTSAANLIPLTADLGRPSLILIHAIAGTVFDYANLAAGPDWHLHRLRPPGPRTNPIAPEPAASVDDVVTQYIDLLRAGLGDKAGDGPVWATRATA